MPDSWRAAAAAFALILAAPFAAHAADECPLVRMGAEGHRKAAQLAAKVLAHLQTTDAKVALLGRAGSDSPQNRFGKKIGFWNYTHAGIAYRNHPAGEWTVAHLLNICGEKSGVFEESFLKFYLDNPHEYRAVAAIPSAPMQDALEELIVRQNAAAGYRNGSIYSSISYPFSTARQNSNEYILDTLAAALAGIEGTTILTRENAKEYFLSSAHRDQFPVEIINTNFWETLGASFGLGPGNATLEDHTPAERAAGKFKFVSVGALIQFLDNLGMLQDAREFALRDISKASDTISEE